jgi:lipopolysaccharide/colanic/teichoic acid biosynthesis glycosyltransferase
MNQLHRHRTGTASQDETPLDRSSRPAVRPVVIVNAPAPIVVVQLSPELRAMADRWDAVSQGKAFFDVLAAAVLLVATAPVILLAMGLIRLTSRGPAIYRQTRLGLFGRSFTIYKLRTMSHNCESATGPRWALPNDPRITRLGWILRRLHIDELPQLWNILRGDMSLIGPRPERPEIIVGLRGDIPGYDRRLLVRPGVTGFAQVFLPPDTSTDDVRRKLVYDRFYLRHRGAWLDARILWLTVLKCLGLQRFYLRPRRY